MEDRFEQDADFQRDCGEQGCGCDEGHGGGHGHHGRGCGCEHGEGHGHRHGHGGMHGRGQECGCDQDGPAPLQHKVTRMGLMLHRYHMLAARGNGVGDASRGQGRVLKLLDAMPGASQRDLAYVLGMRPQSLSELLGKLEAKGLVARQKSPDDARVALVSLTEQGKVAVPSRSTEKDDGPLSVLTDEERSQMEACVDKVSAELERRFEEMVESPRGPMRESERGSDRGSCRGGHHGHGGMHGRGGQYGHGGQYGAVHGGPHGRRGMGEQDESWGGRRAHGAMSGECTGSCRTGRCDCGRMDGQYR